MRVGSHDGAADGTKDGTGDGGVDGTEDGGVDGIGEGADVGSDVGGRVYTTWMDTAVCSSCPIALVDAELSTVMDTFRMLFRTSASAKALAKPASLLLVFTAALRSLVSELASEVTIESRAALVLELFDALAAWAMVSSSMMTVMVNSTKMDEESRRRATSCSGVVSFKALGTTLLISSGEERRDETFTTDSTNAAEWASVNSSGEA